MARPRSAERWGFIGAIRYLKICEVGILAVALVGEAIMFGS
jgi:hypothetical protein